MVAFIKIIKNGKFGVGSAKRAPTHSLASILGGTGHCKARFFKFSISSFFRFIETLLRRSRWRQRRKLFCSSGVALRPFRGQMPLGTWPSTKTPFLRLTFLHTEQNCTTSFSWFTTCSSFETVWKISSWFFLGCSTPPNELYSVRIFWRLIGEAESSFSFALPRSKGA